MQPITKVARLRELMPVIEKKLATGVKLVDIHQTLLAIGFDLPFQTLKKYLYRLRREASVQGPAGKFIKKAIPSMNDSQINSPSELKNHFPDAENLRPAISIQEIGRLMHPDTAQQAEKLARYEKLAKQQRRSQT